MPLSLTGNRVVAGTVGRSQIAEQTRNLLLMSAPFTTERHLKDNGLLDENELLTPEDAEILRTAAFAANLNIKEFHRRLP